MNKKEKQALDNICFGAPDERKIAELKEKTHKLMKSESFAPSDNIETVNASAFEVHESVPSRKRNILAPVLCTAAAFAVVAATAVILSAQSGKVDLTNPANEGTESSASSEMNGVASVPETEEAIQTTAVIVPSETAVPTSPEEPSTTYEYAFIGETELSSTDVISPPFSEDENADFVTLTIPDFRGRPIDEVEEEVKQVGIAITRIYAYTSYPAGVIAECDSTGMHIAKYPEEDAEIIVIVSLGEASDERLPSEAPKLSVPLDNEFISLDYGDSNNADGIQLQENGSTHEEIDFTSASDEIHAAADGVVTFAALNGGYGLMIKIQHTDGSASDILITCYGHCSEISVNVGDFVKRGDVIGKVGSTGWATGDMLSFGVENLSGERLNPHDYLEE